MQNTNFIEYDKKRIEREIIIKTKYNECYKLLQEQFFVKDKISALYCIWSHYYVATQDGKAFARISVNADLKNVWVEYENFNINYQKKGLIQLSMKQILKDIFINNLYNGYGVDGKLTEISATKMRIKPDNIASMTIARHLGFKYNLDSEEAKLVKSEYLRRNSQTNKNELEK